MFKNGLHKQLIQANKQRSSRVRRLSLYDRDFFCKCYAKFKRNTIIVHSSLLGRGELFKVKTKLFIVTWKESVVLYIFYILSSHVYAVNSKLMSNIVFKKPKYLLNKWTLHQHNVSTHQTLYKIQNSLHSPDLIQYDFFLFFREIHSST